MLAAKQRVNERENSSDRLSRVFQQSVIDAANQIADEQFILLRAVLRQRVPFFTLIMDRKNRLN